MSLGIGIGIGVATTNASAAAVIPAGYRYLNPTAGNDANDGKSPGAAWQTFSKATTALAVSSNGITNLLIDTSGGPLRAVTQLIIGANASGVIVDSATAPTKADIRGNKDLINANFTQPNVGTYANVWQTSDTMLRSVLFERGGSNPQDLIWYTHVNGANFAAVAATLNTTAGSFWTDGTTLYFRPLTGNNPVTDGKTYVRSYSYGATNDGNLIQVNIPCTVKNVSAGGNCLCGATSGDDIGGGAYVFACSNPTGIATAQDSYFYYGTKHIAGQLGASGSGGMVLQDVEVAQGSPYCGTGGQTPLVSYADACTNMTAVYRRVTCTKNAGVPGSMAGTASTTYAVMINHNNGSGTQFASIAHIDCNYSQNRLEQGAGCTAGGYTVTGTRLGSALVKDAIFDRCYADRRALLPGSTAGSVTVRNSLIKPSDAVNNSLADWQANGTITYEGCTIDMTASSGTAYFNRIGAIVFSFTNSIFISTTGGASNTALLDNARQAEIISCRRNVYQLASGKRVATAFQQSGTSTRTFAQWQSLGYDLVASQETDPLLNGDYTPTASSPAIGMAYSSLANDYAGAVLHRNTSGMYEYQGAVAQTTPGAFTVGTSAISGTDVLQ